MDKKVAEDSKRFVIEKKLNHGKMSAPTFHLGI
jgi:hypothetical protein